MNAAEKEIYNDNLFDRLFIALLAWKMAAALGKGTQLKGYDGFVDLSKQIVRGRTPREQQELVAAILQSLVPSQLLAIVRAVFSPTQLVCELNAWFGATFFQWLVGPCEIVEVEVPAEDETLRKQKSGIHIEKCRYLENSGCTGMCVNMCKLPTQDFFTQKFGIPLTMIPNFEDLSCEMIFGQRPLPFEEDPAYNQPCLANRCSLGTQSLQPCPKVRS
ncbi:MAG: DUF4033 domain-containing protein [Cyanobacteria bacterium SBLK]|nr:DUF4033 domain-containing protein [Cyanobacteria bacterium SBLK]